jgi:hypothetical protein
MIDPCDPVGLFRSSVPERFLRDIAHGIADAYASREPFRWFPPPEMHDVWPHNRRALIEARLREIAGGYPEMTARVETNNKGDHHSVVEVGPVIMMESKVGSPHHVVRQADFRDTLARSNQLVLAGMEDMEPAPSPGAKLCTILIHGEDPEDPTKLGFLDAVFPTPDGKGYLPSRVHLLPCLTDTATLNDADEQEIIPDNLVIDLRDDLKKEDDA